MTALTFSGTILTLSNEVATLPTLPLFWEVVSNAFGAVVSCQAMLAFGQIGAFDTMPILRKILSLHTFDTSLRISATLATFNHIRT